MDKSSEVDQYIKLANDYFHDHEQQEGQENEYYVVHAEKQRSLDFDHNNDPVFPFPHHFHNCHVYDSEMLADRSDVYAHRHTRDC